MTISQPYVVAKMTETVSAARRLKSVLEIGTGCGYQTAVISRIAEKVYTIERIKPLLDRAKRILNYSALETSNLNMMTVVWVGRKEPF